MDGFDYSSIKQRSKHNTRDSCALDASAAEKISVKNKKDELSTTMASFGPTKNVLVHEDGSTDTQPIKDHSYELHIDLKSEETAKHLESGKPGVSIISDAFDLDRRSWHLKVDIEKPSNEISIWLIERGEPCRDQGALTILRRATPIKFSS